MVGYAKFAVLVLLAVAAQWAIECNRTDVEEAIFLVRCGATNLIGTEAEREQLVEHARELRAKQTERIYAQLDAMPHEALQDQLQGNGAMYVMGAIVTRGVP